MSGEARSLDAIKLTGTERSASRADEDGRPQETWNKVTPKDTLQKLLKGRGDE